MVFVSNYHGPLDLSARVKVGHVFVLAAGSVSNETISRFTRCVPAQLSGGGVRVRVLIRDYTRAAIKK